MVYIIKYIKYMYIYTSIYTYNGVKHNGVIFANFLSVANI